MTIGVFDSGVGGLLIAEKIQKAIPEAVVEFLCDTECFPYGNKSKQFITNRVAYFLNKFVQKECSIVVLACNSATTSSIISMRQKFPLLKIIGIEPPIKPTALLSKKKKVAILGTEATVRSNRFAELIRLYGKDCAIYGVSCPNLARAIEIWVSTKRASNKQLAIDLLFQYMNIALSHNVDVVGLACTHYPYLIEDMKRQYPNMIFYDPTDAVVRQVARAQRECLSV